MQKIYSITKAGKHGHIAPITGNLCIKKISKSEYIDLRNGEICKFKINETKDIENLFSSKQKCIDLIHSNINENSRFMTITTQENIQDRDYYFYLMKLFAKTKIFQEVFGRDYLYTVERQKRGALHSHFICFNPAVKIIPYKKLIEAWRGCIGGLGAVCVKRIDKPDNIGRYLAKYILKEFASVEKYKRVYIPSRGLKQPEKGIITEMELRRMLPGINVKKRAIDGKEMVVGYYW